MIEQADLFSQPLPAQHHSKTSRDAATSMQDHAPSVRARVYRLIYERGPITDEQIATLLELNPSTARPRRIELVAEGLVQAHFETVRTSSGRQATAWVVSEPF